jgi:hypothetical protein
MVEPETPVPVHETERRNLFGDAKLALLYSGNFGKAHSYKEVLDLAWKFSPNEAAFVFSVRGNQFGELAKAIKTGPLNVKMADFAPIEALETRLAAADIHIVTLRSEWSGAVVPSKFFAALATGRPVLFIGSASSGVARWIEEFHVGWALNTEVSSGTTYQLQLGRIVRELKELAEDPPRLQVLFRHCHSVYQANFARQHGLNVWHRELVALSS